MIIACIIWLILLDLWQILPIIINFKAAIQAAIVRQADVKMPRLRQRTAMSPSIKQALVLQSFSSDLTSLKNRRLTYHDSYLVLGMLVLMQISISHLSSARGWKKLL